MRCSGTSLAARLIPTSSEKEVLFDDLAALLAVGVQPTANGLGRKASISERTDDGCRSPMSQTTDQLRLPWRSER